MKFYISYSLLIFMHFPMGVGSSAYGSNYRYFVFGDSMVKTGFGNVIKKRLTEQAAGPVRVFGKSSSGFSRPDIFDWQNAMNTELKAAALQDQVTVFVMIGTNDCQDIPMPHGVLKYDTDEWKAAYRDRIQAFAQVLCQRVRQVYWVGLPTMRSKKFNEKIMRLNEFTRESLKPHKCIEYFPTQNILGTNTGEYAKSIKIQSKNVNIRATDGIHISYEGAKVLADHLVAHIAIGPSGISK